MPKSKTLEKSRKSLAEIFIGKLVLIYALNAVLLDSNSMKVVTQVWNGAVGGCMR